MCQVIPDNILNSSVEIVRIYPNTQLISGQAFTITENIKFYNISNINSVCNVGSG